MTPSTTHSDQKHKPTEEIAKKVLQVVNKGLVKGLGVRKPGKMCIEAAVCYAFDLPHGDNPPCVGSGVREFKISLNDSEWPSDEDRASGMRDLSVAQLGSDTIDQKKFLEKVGLQCIKNILPVILENSLKEDADKNFFKECIDIKELKKVIEELHTVKTFKKARAVARKAWKIYSVYTIVYAHTSASFYASAYASVYAHSSIYSSPPYTTNSAYLYAKKNPTFNLKILNMTAQAGLEALKELKSPGCQWLHLCK